MDFRHGVSTHISRRDKYLGTGMEQQGNQREANDRLLQEVCNLRESVLFC